LFILPGFLAILALSYVYALLGDIDVVQGLVLGLETAVLESLLSLAAVIAVFRLRLGVLSVLATCAAPGIMLRLTGLA
jgi:chromate transporter